MGSRLLRAAIGVLALARTALAAPSSPTPFFLTQPDGHVFRAVQKGDEKNAWIETDEGYTVTQNARAEWVYAEKGEISPQETAALALLPASRRMTGTGALKPGARVVGKHRPDGLDRHIRPAPKKIQPPAGKEEDAPPCPTCPLKRRPVQPMPPPNGGPADDEAPDAPSSPAAPPRLGPALDPPAPTVAKVVVLLIDFTNKGFSGGHDQAYYQNLIFNEANPGSLRSYYREVSYGLLDLTGIVAPVVTSTKTMEWYGTDGPPNSCAYDSGSIDTRNGCIFELAREAVTKADPYVDYSQYDQDADGKVDYVVIVHAGAGQEQSHTTTDIWSHKWNIPSGQNTAEGKKVADYAMQAESSPLGVFAHEFAHLLGLPDLYNTGSGTSVVGKWDLMDDGSWNNSGHTPAHLCAWNKIAKGWITATVVDGQVGATVTPLATTAAAYRLEDWPLKNSKEYFLLENRQLTGFDAYLPSTGLLIWHIDDDAADNNGTPKRVMPELAGGTLSSAPFGSGSFNSATTPNSNTNSGASTTVYANSIARAGSNMTALLFGGFPRLEAYAVTPGAIVIRGQPFTFRTGVRALIGNCGNVTAWADPAAITCSQSPCVADQTRIKSRDNLATPEPNAPNTIDGCPDGTKGVYLTNGASVESITVTNLDRTAFRGGDRVRVDASVHASNTSRKVNFVYTSNSTTPVWRILGTYTPPSSGTRSYSHTFTLDNVPGTHTIRVNVHPSAFGVRACADDTGSDYTDTDDVSLLVGSGKGIIPTTPGSEPFYTTSAQPQARAGMPAGDDWVSQWTVYATGALGDYEFFTFYNSSLPDVAPVESPKVKVTIFQCTPSLDHAWVYQNTESTTQWRHKCVLTLAITGLSNYSVNVTQKPGSTGDVVVVPTASPLVWDILGSRRGVGNIGPATLDIAIADAANPQIATSTTVSVDVRLLGDVNKDGSVTTDDGVQLAKKLNNLNVAPLQPRDFDLTGDGFATTDDDVLLVRILNNLPVP